MNLSVPLGNRFAKANYANVEALMNQARYDLQRQEQAAFVEVRTAVRTVETNLKRVKAAQVNSRLQREKLDAEQKKFENGMSTSFQVLSFQNDLATAESGENQALVDYNKSLTELERVKGTLLEARKIVVPSAGPEERSAADLSPSLSARSRWRPVTGLRAESLLGADPGRDAGPGEGAVSLAAEPVDVESVTLPTAFMFTGDRIVGVGGTPATGGAAGGR